MKTTVKFRTLTDVANYIKTINPGGYKINTQELTLSSTLSSFELAVAIEQYGAVIVQQGVVA